MATLVLVHGGYHGSWYWRVWARWLAGRGWRCLPLDLPGHGAHRLPPASFAGLGVADYAAAVARAAGRAGGTGRCVLVGHSLGGLVAQAAAALVRPAAMVLLCTSPVRAVADRGWPAVPTGWPVPPPGEAEMVRRWYHRPAHRAFGGYPALHRLLVPESPVALNDRYLNRVDAPRARCPVLVVGSALDERHGRGRIDTDTAAHHDADLYLAPDHGHGLCAEDGTEKVLARVACWLADTLGAPAGESTVEGGERA